MAERRVVAVARGQRGIVRLEELEAAGLSRDQVGHRVRTGWLVHLHEGVYAVGTVGAIGLVQAALFACGANSLAHNATAAALHDLLPYPDTVHVAVPRNGPRPPGIKTYHPTVLPEWTLRHGLRTATVPELLLSLAATDPTAAAEATDAAFIARRTSTAALRAFLSAKKGHRGAARLRDIIDGPRTRSGAEREFLRLLDAARLPRPLANVRVNGHLVDFLWPDHGLIVETDGWASHGRRSQWEADRRRDLDHFVAGVDVLRLTARQLDAEPYAVVAALTRRLAASAPRRATAAS